jgi:hypothetical protein
MIHAACGETEVGDRIGSSMPHVGSEYPHKRMFLLEKNNMTHYGYKKIDSGAMMGQDRLTTDPSN